MHSPLPTAMATMTNPLLNNGLCCCGKKEIDEPIIVNDYRHEPFGEAGAFCGPAYKHEIRDAHNKIEALQAELDLLYDATDK